MGLSFLPFLPLRTVSGNRVWWLRAEPKPQLLYIVLHHAHAYMMDLLLLQFVIVSLSGWGLLIFGGFKAFSGGKKEEVFTFSSFRTLNLIYVILHVRAFWFRLVFVFINLQFYIQLYITNGNMH